MEIPSTTGTTELGGVEYEAAPCAHCRQTGERYDPTLAENIHNQRRGIIRCRWCDGRGVIFKITRRGLEQERARFEARQHSPEKGEPTIGDIAAGARAVYIPAGRSPIIAMTFEPTQDEGLPR